MSTAAQLLDALAAETDDDAREQLVSSLEDCGPPETADLPKIAHHLAATDGDSAYWAATLLGRAGAAAADWVNDLVAATHHENLAARERAVWALGRIGSAAKTAIPRLRQLNKTSASHRMARLAVEAISAIEGP